MPPALLGVLEEARHRGYLGPGPVEDHVAHALGFADAVGAAVPGRALDLGSGGGVPGLVLALHWPASTWVLLDALLQRTRFLNEAVAALDLDDRVVVDRTRAEEAGRRPDRRACFDLVTARGFGPPAVVAECAAPFLRAGGHLVVSEPPSGDDRWPAEPLAALGLRPRPPGGRYRVLDATSACPDRFPRRVGIPAKRPLF